MLHPANSQLLIGAVVLLLACVLAIGLILGKRRKRAAEFRNYFCSAFDRDFFPSSSFGDDDSTGGNQPKFTPIRIRSFESNQRGVRTGSPSRHDLE